MAGSLKIRWWDRLPFLYWRVAQEVESADEIPIKLPRNGAVVVSAGKMPKWIAFDCPCHTGHRILLNLDTARYPYWRIKRAKRDRLTISPSVDSIEAGKRCHYFIRDGKISWAKD